MMGQWIKSTVCSLLQVYGLLETLVAGPKFLAKLTAAREKQSSTATEFHGREVLEPGWWEPPGPPASSGPEIDSTEVDGYEQVIHQPPFILREDA